MTGINYQLRSTVVVIMLKLLLLLLQGWSSEACLEEDRVALLRLKDSFLTEEGMFSWRKEVDCCEWVGVGCNTTTGRVNELMLDFFRHGDSVDNWYFNASMFLPFQELRNLSLRDNNVVCCVKNEGFEELQKLSKLEYLNLANNDLNISILPLLRGLHSLRILYIHDTKQNGSINMEDLLALSNLEELDISGNNFDKFVVSKDIEGLRNISALWIHNFGSKFQLPSLRAFSNHKSLNLYGNFTSRESFLQGLSNFKNLKKLHLKSGVWGNINSLLESIANMTSLETLSLEFCELSGSVRDTKGLCEMKNLRNLVFSHNNLNGALPRCLVNLTLLEELDLSHNYFSGNIRGTEGLCQLKNLQNLILSDNNLSDALPHCLVNLTLLQELDLSHNYFSGNVLQSPLIGLTSITSLSLSYNRFKFPSSLSPFLNHSKLKSFEGDENEIYAETRMINHNSTPKFQLKRLSLRSTSGGGSFPEFLYHQHDLQYLDISGIPMIGLGFPSWLLENNTKLEILCLSNCSLSDVENLHQSTFHWMLIISTNQRFIEWDFSYNNLNGLIPFELGNIDYINLLNLSHNNFIGPIPLSFSKMTKIETLDLSFNNLNDKIPFLLTKLNFLTVFYVSYNNLSGEIPGVAQFATFDETSYLGNPFLCGMPLPKSCINEETTSEDDDVDDGAIDMEVFYISFSVSFVIILAGIAGVLCINPYWRKAWFYFIEMVIDSCYYFVLDCLSYLSKLWAR